MRHAVADRMRVRRGLEVMESTHELPGGFIRHDRESSRRSNLRGGGRGRDRNVLDVGEIAQDLLSRGAAMNVGIRLVLELPRPEPAMRRRK